MSSYNMCICVSGAVYVCLHSFHKINIALSKENLVLFRHCHLFKALFVGLL